MDTNDLLRQWARLGILFGVQPADTTPDIEKLLIDTVVMLPQIPRLLPACVTWLTHYERLVCRHRLAVFAADVSAAETSAALGLLLSIAKQFSKTEHLHLAVNTCRPLTQSRPLFMVDRMSPTLARLALNKSDSLGRQWGLAYDAIQLKQDAIRPLSWVMRHNPSLKDRALFSGNLRVSILETLAHDKHAGQSESVLARRCRATRKAVREALDHLEFCQLVARQSFADRTQIVLCPN